MDDKNQINQPQSPVFPPIVPSVPEDITPVDTPVATTTTQTPFPPAQSPFTQPVLPPTPISEPFTTQTPPVMDPEMPKSKPKSKLMPIIGGIAALLLVVGVAGAAYYVSNQLSTKVAVAPNAPTSKPSACVTDQITVALGAGCPSGYDGCGPTCCSRCVDTGGGGGGVSGCAAVESGVGTSHPACVGKNPGDAVCYQGMNLVCFRGTNTLCGANAGGNACTPSPTPTNPPGYVCPWGCDDTKCTDSECGGGAGTSCPAGQYCCQPYTVEHCGGGPTGTPTPTATPTNTPTISPTITPVIGACMNIKIYKVVDGVAQMGVALDATALGNLKVGDVLMLAVTGNVDSLRGRFRVTIDSTPGEWLTATTQAENKKLSTYLYTITKAGTYKFEAQVSKAP